MIHPVLKLIASHPHLLADHAQAYGGLVGEELNKTVSAWKTKVAMLALAGVLIFIAVILAGVALMFWAVVPASNIHAGWALFVAPAVPAAGAAVCFFAGQHKPDPMFKGVKEQFAADMAMLREVSAS